MGGDDSRDNQRPIEKRRLRLIPNRRRPRPRRPPRSVADGRSSYLNTRHAAASRSAPIAPSRPPPPRPWPSPVLPRRASSLHRAASTCVLDAPPSARGDPRRRQVLHVLHRVARVFHAEVLGHDCVERRWRAVGGGRSPGWGLGAGARETGSWTTIARGAADPDAARSSPLSRSFARRSPRSSTASRLSGFATLKSTPFPRDYWAFPAGGTALPFHAAIEHVGAALIAVHVASSPTAVHAPHRLADEPDPLELVPLPFLDGVTLRLGTAVSSISPPPRPMDPCSMDTSHRVTPVSGIAGC